MRDRTRAGLSCHFVASAGSTRGNPPAVAAVLERFRHERTQLVDPVEALPLDDLLIFDHDSRTPAVPSMTMAWQWTPALVSRQAVTICNDPKFIRPPGSKGERCELLGSSKITHS